MIQSAQSIKDLLLIPEGPTMRARAIPVYELSTWRCYTRAMITELSFRPIVRMLGFPADILRNKSG